MTFVSAPARRFGPAGWLLVGAATAFTFAAQALSPGPLKDSLAYVIALIPGALTALVFRSVLAGVAVALAPMYFVIGHAQRGLPAHMPMVALDRAWPVRPAWMLVYGSLYIFVAILPFLVIRQRDLGQRALKAYIAVMLVAFAGFLVYPTSAPPRLVPIAGGFSAWALRLCYDLDTPNNCFPSLHVAYAFVAALACYRVHRGVGAVAIAWAALIGLSALYTRQHYVVDVIAGAFMGWVSYLIFLRGHPREAVEPWVRSGAPLRAAAAVAVYLVMIAGFAVLYTVRS